MRTPVSPSDWIGRWGTFVAVLVIFLAGLAAYSNSFSCPLVLDDASAISDNPSITHLADSLRPPVGATVAGRPLLNLSFAVNYALTGYGVWSYHLLNLLIHVLAALALFGIVRRTLVKIELAKLEPLALSLSIAVLWVVHPLQTEAVTYISQRAETLMGLLYLQTLYGFIRGVQPGSSKGWLIFSIGSCLSGAMVKEIIVTAPVMVLLYDAAFFSGSCREAFKLRWRYYLGMSTSWLLLAFMMSGHRLPDAGYGPPVSAWTYGLTSCRSIWKYLELSVWPHPLVFDYGFRMDQDPMSVLPFVLGVAALVAVIAVTWVRRPMLGFTGAWFLLILVPAHSIVPVALQPLAEHRMYLSLAAVIVLVVIGLRRLLGTRCYLALLAGCLALGGLTFERNRDFQSESVLWKDTVAKCPDNERAHTNLGIALSRLPGRLQDAISEYRTALSINPEYGEARLNLANAYAKMPEHLGDAIDEVQRVLRSRPDSFYAHNNLGALLSGVPGRTDEAIAEYRAALRLNPDYAQAHVNLGALLEKIPGGVPGAIAEYEEAIRLKPDTVDAHYNLGNMWVNQPGRLSDAIDEYRVALRYKPDFSKAHLNLGNIYAQFPGRTSEAVSEYEEVLRLDPRSALAHCNLGIVLASDPARYSEAASHFETALQIDPNLSLARQGLAQLRASNPRDN